MKLLFVSAYFAYPRVAHGGGTDLFHLIEALATQHEVHLISFADEWEIAEAEEMRTYCRSVELIVPANRWGDKARSAWRSVRSHPVRAPLLLGRRSHGEMRRLIAKVVREEGIDLVQFEWTEAGQFRDAVPARTAVTILDEVDVSFRPRLQAARLETGWVRRWRASRRAGRARARELELCRQFDAVLTRSEADRQLLSELAPGQRVHVLAPWTRVAEFADVEEEESERDVLLFVGAMDRPPNVDAVLQFYYRVYPLVRRAEPRVRFLVVGTDPTPAVRALARDPSVAVTGYVEDLRPYYARCRVFVAPLRIGGGVINKTVDALAAGRPAVTTPAGNVGIGAQAGEEILVAESADEFAAQVVTLLRDGRIWSKVARGGRDFVRRTFDWPRTVAKLEGLYGELLEQRNGERALAVER